MWIAPHSVAGCGALAWAARGGDTECCSLRDGLVFALPFGGSLVAWLPGVDLASDQGVGCYWLQWGGALEGPNGASLVCMLVDALVEVKVLGLGDGGPWRVMSGRSGRFEMCISLSGGDLAAAVVVEGEEAELSVERGDHCSLDVFCRRSDGIVSYTCLLEWPLGRAVSLGEEWVRTSFLSGILRLDPDSAQAFYRDDGGSEVVVARYSCEA